MDTAATMRVAEVEHREETIDVHLTGDPAEDYPSLRVRQREEDDQEKDLNNAVNDENNEYRLLTYSGRLRGTNVKTVPRLKQYTMAFS